MRNESEYRNQDLLLNEQIILTNRLSSECIIVGRFPWSSLDRSSFKKNPKKTKVNLTVVTQKKTFLKQIYVSREEVLNSFSFNSLHLKTTNVESHTCLLLACAPIFTSCRQWMVAELVSRGVDRRSE